jgi:hypothetical protein
VTFTLLEGDPICVLAHGERRVRVFLKGATAPEAVAEIVDQLPSQAAHFFAAEFLRLFRNLAELDHGVKSAYEAGDSEFARLHVEAFIRALQESLRRTVEGGFEKYLLKTECSNFFSADLVCDAIRFARSGHHHWLTTLNPDDLRVSADDFYRVEIEAVSAAVLDVFGPMHGGPRTVAEKIAMSLTKSGFLTKRRGPPRGSTVHDWLKYVRQSVADSSPSLQHRVRRVIFDVLRRFFKGVSFEEALDSLERHCRASAPRMIGARPVKPP